MKKGRYVVSVAQFPIAARPLPFGRVVRLRPQLADVACVLAPASFLPVRQRKMQDEGGERGALAPVPSSRLSEPGQNRWEATTGREEGGKGWRGGRRTAPTEGGAACHASPSRPSRRCHFAADPSSITRHLSNGHLVAPRKAHRLCQPGRGGGTGHDDAASRHCPAFALSGAHVREGSVAISLPPPPTLSIIG